MESEVNTPKTPTNNLLQHLCPGQTEVVPSAPTWNDEWRPLSGRLKIIPPLKLSVCLCSICRHMFVEFSPKLIQHLCVSKRFVISNLKVKPQVAKCFVNRTEVACVFAHFSVSTSKIYSASAQAPRSCSLTAREDSTFVALHGEHSAMGGWMNGYFLDSLSYES